MNLASKADRQPPWQAWLAPLTQKWQQMGSRERFGTACAGIALLVLLLWTVALGPAITTLREAPAKLDALETELQAMQRLAGEARDLRAAPPINRAQATESLKAATDRLGASAKLSLQGDRGVLTLNGTSAGALRQWLSEVRAGARARAIEAQLNRGPTGFTGTVVVNVGGGG